MFVYEKENLDLIPLDLVGIQMQSKAAAVCGVNGGVLRLVRIVHHTILAVLDVGVNFYIIIGAEPCMQFLLAVGTPQDSAVKGAAVGKTVRHTADVHGTTLAEVVCRHLHFFVSLHQYFGAFQRIDVLLAFAKVDGPVGVFQDEVVRVFFPVVLVVVEGEAVFFFHAQHAGKLENVA